jgi:CRP-like cAMP-binding protein
MSKILIIEDNTDIRENLAEILELDGYETIQAENGKIGLEKAMADSPDLIICDVMMPVLDGFGVLKILNRNPKLMHVPFMFLTAKSEKSDFRKGMGLGADDYITKPFDDVELLEAIQIRLKKSASIKSIQNSDQGLKQLFDEARAEKELQRLSTDREIRKYKAKDIIYEEGQHPKWLFFVVSGKIKAYKENDFGKELITNIYTAGDFFSFIPMLKESTYSDYASALEDTELRLIPFEDFKLLLFNNRDFAAKFIKMMANHADDAEQQLIDLAYSSVRKKVANALIILLKGSPDDKINVLRDDLASLAGTAKETVIRTLSEFKSDGHIVIEGGSIKILNKAALENMPQ